MNSTELIKSSLPTSFLEPLVFGLEGAYTDAAARVSRFNSATADRHLGYERWAWIEELFSRMPDLAPGCETHSFQNSRKSASHWMILQGNLRLTQIKVEGGFAFPRHADHRDCYAGSWQAPLGLYGEVQTPPEWLNQSDGFYAILTHSPHPADRSLVASAMIGFPNADGKRWAAPPVDILRLLQERHNTVSQEEVVVEPMLALRQRHLRRAETS